MTANLRRVAFWNRESGSVWVNSYDHDACRVRTDSLGVASDQLAAYALLADAGYSRNGDWLLVESSSPMRQMTVTD